MNEKLREGLDDILLNFAYWGIDQSECAEKIITLFRQHDGHAEFVRDIQKIAERFQNFSSPLNLRDGLSNIIRLCDAELAKEQSNG